MTAAADGERPRVLLVTEGTYPHHWGGVSTWAHALIEQLDDVDFVLMALTDDPSLRLRFELPGNVVELRTLPLWGLRDAWELRRRPAPIAREGELRRNLARPLRVLLEQVLSPRDDPGTVGEALIALHRFFQARDFDEALRSKTAWQALNGTATRGFPAAARSYGYPDARATPEDVVTAARRLRHWLFPLAAELPEVEVAHATMAGLCGVVAAVAKLEQGARFVLSEHGIYLRESYLAESADGDSLFAKVFRLGFARATTALAYSLADVVAPCCAYNTRWERRLGVPAERLRVAYYGVSCEAGEPAGAGASVSLTERSHGSSPVIAWAGRIDPLKDVETLLHAAAIVLAERPEAVFRLVGSAPPGQEEYHARCLRLRDELGIVDGVHFEGYHASPGAILASADVVVLSSISEGFPFVTLEAMARGRPIVATAVGGLAEQLGRAGELVRPRDAKALAEAILGLLADDERRATLAEAAARRASERFSLEGFRETHRALYQGEAAA
jgi:glycosyltransferase involved in cell wall biosynthesis